jgi:hypothetical protein
LVGALVVGGFVGALVVGALEGFLVVGGFVGALVVGGFVGALVVGAFDETPVVGALVGDSCWTRRASTVTEVEAGALTEESVRWEVAAWLEEIVDSVLRRKDSIL